VFADGGRTVTFDEETIEFLDALKPSTRSIYSAGLEAFQAFYAQQGTIKDFLDRTEQDQQLPRRERKRVARTTLKGFVEWMKTQTTFKPKTIRTYVGAVQSLARYLEIDVSTRYTGLPVPNPSSKKYPWTLESVGKFAALMDKPLYKCLVAVFFQSGLGVSDVLALTCEDVKTEYEVGTVPLCLGLVRIKTATPHVTFLGKLGVELLHNYLLTRGPLDPADRLFPVSKTAIERLFVRKSKRLKEDHEGLVRCGPHTLRTAFRTLIVDAGCPETYAEFFMGHNLTSDIKKIYMSKTRDGWRAEYAKYEKAVTYSLEEGK
jgi:integrase